MIRCCIFLVVAGLCIPFNTLGQGQLSGDFQLNSNFYDDDPNIGTNTTHYKNELAGGEGWLFLNYRIKGFKFSARYDGFYNSALLDPQEAYSEQGLGFYAISKDIEDLNITAGHFYDQIGNGLIFRAYEDRTLGLDYAVQGLRLNYDIADGFRAKGFVGKQKKRFETYNPMLKGGNIEKDFWINDSLQLYSGVGLVNRTHDQQTMDRIVEEINSYDLEDRFIPKYNVYSYTFYNTINYKSLNWYLEYARKTDDVIRNQAGSQLIKEDGYTLYTSLNYSFPGFGVNLQYRKSETFNFNMTPYTEPLRGVINYLPPIAKQHSMRLTGRYSPQTINFGEEGYQADFTISPSNKSTINVNLSYIQNGEDQRLFSAPSIAYQSVVNGEDNSSPADKLYHEVNVDYYRRWTRNFKSTVGLQTVHYDRRVFQGKPSANMVKTITPFSEFTFKLDRRKSIRTELQYLSTEQDKGNMAFGLVEFNVAPHYSISVSDMVNTEPRKNGELKDDQDFIHYYNIFGAYTLNQTRFTLGYVKQVEGIVCTGGVCRVEPAFSGVKFGVSTNF